MAKKKPIDPEQVAKLARKHWKISQIAAFFDVSRDTIERRFAAIIQKNKLLGAAVPLDLAWDEAVTRKNWRAIEWLLKNVSKFDDKVVVEHKGPGLLSKQSEVDSALTRLETLFNEIKSQPKDEDREKRIGLIAQKLGIGT
jgi:hypothetical protein